MCVLCRLITLAGFLALFLLIHSVFAPKPKTVIDLQYECTLRRGIWVSDKMICDYNALVHDGLVTIAPPKKEEPSK